MKIQPVGCRYADQRHALSAFRGTFGEG